MKFLIVALAALALASAQTTTTVSTTLGVTLVGNADGTATITVGTGPGVTIPAAAVTAVKAIVGLVNTAVSGVTAGSNTAISLPISVNKGTGAVSVTFNGNTYTLDQATVAQVMALQGQVLQSLMGVLPMPPPPTFPGQPPFPAPPTIPGQPPFPAPPTGPFVRYRGREMERGREGHHRG